MCKYFLFFLFIFCSPCFVNISFRGLRVQRPNGFGDCLFGPTVFQVLLIYSINSTELLKTVFFHNIFNVTFTKKPAIIIIQYVPLQSVLKWTKKKHCFFFFILPLRCQTLLILYLLVLFVFRQKELQRPGNSIY
jgi:hypothetical protein